MELHYSKHHKGHVEKYNTLSWLAEQAFLNKDYQNYIGYLDSIEFNYHGHLNHQFFGKIFLLITYEEVMEET